MPIQSTPVTTQSTINLSDINIDTDLNMGSNSIIGYISTSNITDYVKFYDITSGKFLTLKATSLTRSDLTVSY